MQAINQENGMDFARVGERYMYRCGGNTGPLINNIGPTPVERWPLRDGEWSFNATGAWGNVFEGDRDLIARIDSGGRVVEVNPNLPVDDEARARVKVDAFYLPATLITPDDAAAQLDVNRRQSAVMAGLAKPTYSPGQWVVTAGGTQDKAEKLVELRAPRDGVFSTWGPDGYGGWFADGTTGPVPGSETPTKTERHLGPILRLATDEEVKRGKVFTHTSVYRQSLDGKKIHPIGTLDHETGVFTDAPPPPKTAAEWGRMVVEGRKLNKHDRTRLYVMVGKREEELVGLRAALSDMEKSRDLHSEVRAQSEHELHALITRYKMVQAFAYGDVDEIIVPDEDALIREVRRLKAAVVEAAVLRSTLASRWPWYNWFVAGMAAAAALVAGARALGWV